MTALIFNLCSILPGFGLDWRSLTTHSNAFFEDIHCQSTPFFTADSLLWRLERRNPSGRNPNTRMVAKRGTDRATIGKRGDDGPAGKSRMDTWRFEYSILPKG